MSDEYPLFSVPVVKGRIVPGEYEDAATETCLLYTSDAADEEEV